MRREHRRGFPSWSHFVRVPGVSCRALTPSVLQESARSMSGAGDQLTMVRDQLSIKMSRGHSKFHTVPLVPIKAPKNY